MKKKIAILLALVFVFSIIVAGCGSSKDAKSDSKPAKKVIRMGFGLNDKSPQYEGAKKFADIVAQKTNGRYEVQIFHSSQLGDDLGLMEKLKMGTLEMCFPSTSPIASFDKRFMIFDFPFLFKNEQIADKVLDGPFGDKMLKMLEQNGIIGLAFSENGFRDLTNSKREVAKLDDFKGLKIRTMQNPVHLESFKLLGANPTPMAFGELFPAMQQGTVDGQENPIPTIYNSKFYEVQKYATLSHHFYTPFILMYSKKLWDEIPADDQKIFREAAKEGAKTIREVNRKQTNEMIPDLEKKGMKVSKISDAELARIQDAVKPVFDKYKDQVGAQLMDEFLAEIKKAESK
jgi:tripartite ATP-independent transporter DctP family solute receptor